MPRFFRLFLAVLLAAGVGVEAAPKKAAKKADPVIKAAPVETRPVAALADRAAIWHTWTDKEGRKVDAQFCGLSGDFITIQTRDGRTYHFKTDILVPEDVVFARQCLDRSRSHRFSREIIASAAADIDKIVGAVLTANQQKPNAPASDEEFLRRIYLDAAGRIPTAKEAEAFLASAAPDKRAQLIDELVFSPGYAMQMFNWMADLLRVKDTFGKGVPAFTFEDWLKARLAANAPWDKLVFEMVTADGRLCDNGATGFMLFDAEMPLDGVSNLMTTFLGTNMACAQCHDHPLADWTQKDFYQMAAFFGATDGKDEGVLREVNRIAKADNAVNKAAVRKIAEMNAFRLADDTKQSLTLPKDYKYKDGKPGDPVAPALIAWAKADKSLPAYNVSTKDPARLRDEFARWLTSPQNPRFATNIANRVWKKAFGLGVIEPVHDIDDLTQASSPELLAHLTFVMKAAKFDLREVQRVIYNSKTYQASASPTPDLGKAKYLFNGPIVRRLTAEQAWDSLVVTAVGTYADNVLLRRGDDIKVMALPAGKVTMAEVRNAIDRTKKAFAGSGKAGGKKGSGGSTMGLANGYEGDKPVSRYSLLLARASELPQPSAETHFLRLWGQGDRLLADSATNDGSVPQVLQMMNGSVGRLVADTRAEAVMAAEAAKTPEAQVRSLYLSFLARRPTPTELTAAKASLEGGLALTDLAWVLANTREFLFIR
ncbi:MAG: DUF1549 domain-containing protein [Verrucomicrobia bacterium]|nr:DUF1549 domain-containing protein [Verrucomicrobiota bacterium]